MDQWKGAPAALDPRLPRATSTGSDPAPLICFSHLRWNFVFQRPQHLMTRAASGRRVFFWEEPTWVDAAQAGDGEFGLQLQATKQGVTVATAVLPAGMNEPSVLEAQRAMLDRLVSRERITDAVLWYYTPQALPFSDHLTTQRPVVYDCMD